MSRLLTVTMLAFLLALTSPASAQDRRAIAAARAFFEQGIEAFEAGRMDEAEDRFRRSLALHEVVSVKFNLAAVLAERGRIVEARELFEEVQRAPDVPERMAAAARDRASALEQRFAHLTVHVPDEQGLTLTVDERALEPSMWGVPVPIDPGSHQLVLTSPDGRRAEVTVALVEGQRDEARLELERPPPAITPELVARTTAPASPTPPRGDDGVWIAIVVGVTAAALIAGGIVIGVVIEEGRFFVGNLGRVSTPGE